MKSNRTELESNSGVTSWQGVGEGMAHEEGGRV